MSISNIPSNPLQPAAPLVEPSEQSLEAVQKVQNLVFVDAAVKNPEQLLSGIKADEIVLLDSTRDGIDQITSVLAQHHNLASVHIFSHGETGIVQLGNTFISATNLDHYASQLKQWGDSLDQQGDLLFYGCNVATGLDGQSFVEQISQITGADVAASNDVTGTTDPNEDWNLDANNTALEGDWDLEITVGDIEANSVTDVAALEKYEGTLPLYNGNRYELTSSLKTWEAAQAEAASLGGNLVTINNAAEETWLKQTFGDTEGFWIGINDRRAEGQFEWASGEAVTYTNWAPGEPNNGGGAQDYGWMNFGTAKQWDDNTPTAQFRGIIEIGSAGSTNPGVFGLEADTITVNEGAGTALVTVLRNQGSTGTATINYRTIAGTATAGSDYTGQTGTLTFAPGETRKSVSIPILKDSLTEADEIFSFTIENPTGGATLSASQTAQVTIKDSQSFTYNGNRYELTSSLKTWEAAQAEAASLGGNLVTINNAAEETWLKQTFGDTEGFWIGINDRRAEGQFEWASGEAVTYTNWAPGEPNNGDGVQDYGWMNFGTTKQWDDTSPAAQYKGIIEIKGGSTNPGVFGLETSTITTNEGAGTALVTVLRNQGSTGTVTIDYRTVAGTATAGSDYTGQSGTLTFAPGETRKSVSIPILQDSLIEGDEIFGFAIDNPTGGATLLVPRTAQVTIKDDEGSIYNGNRYILTNTAKTWEAAKVEAESLGGNLVTINNAAEETWLKQTFGDTEGFWIGINDRRAEGQFEWTSGEAVTYTNWAPGEPNNGGGVQDYGWMNAGTTKQWDDASPTTQYKGIIEISPTFNGKRYALTSTAKTWEAAQVEAASLGGNLVTINNAAEETWLKQTFGDTEGFWIGINDRRAEGQFEWANGEAVTYTNWAPGEPNNGGGAQDYGWMNFGTAKQWDDTSATAQYRGIIEIDPGSPSEQAVTKETVIFGLEQPTAIEWTPGGSKMLVAEKGGVVRVYENGALLPTPFIDISARVNVSADRGLLDIAIHPDFPNTPYVYLLYAYDPPEVNNYIGDAVAGPDGVGNRAGRLTRVTADASTNYTTAVPGSEVILLGTNSTWANFNGLVNSTIDFDEPPAGILPNGTNLRDFLAADSDSHTIGSVEFGLDGALYVTNGDGTSYNRVDPRTVRVQDIDNLSGKVLRINPITGAGLPDNPFYNGDSAANRSKVYQYGLRNPFRTTVHPQTGQLFVGDVGWTKWEEVNTAGPGANFGWPYFEGGSGTNFRTEEYQNLPEAQAFYASGQTTTPSIFALSHSADGINAIVMGDVYTGSLYPEKYRGDLFVNDLGQGIVRNISFDTSGDIESVETFTTGANVVVQIIQGPDGKLYYVDLDDGVVGRWTVV